MLGRTSLRTPEVFCTREVLGGGGHPFVRDDSFKRVSGVCSQSRNVDAGCDPWVRLRFDSYTHFHAFCAFVETRKLSPTMTNTDVAAEWWKTKFTASYVVHKWNFESFARRWSTNSSSVFIKFSFASEFMKGIYIHPGQVLRSVEQNPTATRTPYVCLICTVKRLEVLLNLGMHTWRRTFPLQGMLYVGILSENFRIRSYFQTIVTIPQWDPCWLIEETERHF